MANVKLSQPQLNALHFLMGCVRAESSRPSKEIPWAKPETLYCLQKWGLVESTYDELGNGTVSVTESGRVAYSTGKRRA